MTNNNWKKRAESLPHYKPAHETQGGRSIEDVLNNVPGLPKQQRQSTTTQNDGGWGRELDLTSRFSGMLPQSVEALKAFHMAKNPLQQQEQGAGPASAIVYLKEGQISYRKLNGADYSPVNLAISVGPLAGVTGREFRLIGTKSFYILENQNQRIDLANIDHSKMRNLVAVEAPFLGTILVHESAVVHAGITNKQILKG